MEKMESIDPQGNFGEENKRTGGFKGVWDMVYKKIKGRSRKRKGTHQGELGGCTSAV